MRVGAGRVRGGDHEHQCGQRRDGDRHPRDRVGAGSTPTQPFQNRGHEERPGNTGHPEQVGTVGSLHRLGQESDRHEAHGDEHGGPGPSGVVGGPGSTMGQGADARNEHRRDRKQEEPDEELLGLADVGERPRRGDLLADDLQRTVEMRPRWRTGQFPARAQVHHGVDEHSLDDRPRTGLDEVNPERRRAHHHSGERESPRATGTLPERVGGHQDEGDNEVRSEREGHAGQNSRDQTAESCVRTGALTVDRSNEEDQRPEGQTQSATPRQGLESDGCEDEQRGTGADDHRDTASPRTSQHVQGGDREEVLPQTEPALGGDRDPEEFEPPGEEMQRAGAVQVEEVDVGDGTLQNAFGEDQHEAFLHGGSDRTEQSGERRQHGEHDRAERRPSLQRGTGERASRVEPLSGNEDGGRGSVDASIVVSVGRRESSAESIEYGEHADGRQHAQRRFGRNAEPCGAVGVRRREGDADEERRERDQPHVPTTKLTHSDDRERGEAVVHQESGACGLFVAALDRRELRVLDGAEELPLAADAGGDHLGELPDVVAGVVEADLPPEQGLLGFVAGGIDAPIAQVLLAREVPEAEELSGVHDVAVRVHEEFVAVGGQRNRHLEGARVANGPRSDDDDAGHGGPGDVGDPSAHGQIATQEHPWHDEEHREQQSLAARQCGQAGEQSHGDSPPTSGRGLPLERRPHGGGGAQRHQSLGEQHAVDDPEVRIDGGQHHGHDRHAIPPVGLGDLAGDQSDEGHHRGADDEREHLVVEERRAAET
ncbi:unannotated protein [freshwater metagenome]|uniref:Unannotated protein n=1 Tax=freshwater metagenome TaxID=449393 RepID=A0A6J6F4F6_9ZZZZ